MFFLATVRERVRRAFSVASAIGSRLFFDISRPRYCPVHDKHRAAEQTLRTRRETKGHRKTLHAPSFLRLPRRSFVAGPRVLGVPQLRTDGQRRSPSSVPSRWENDSRVARGTMVLGSKVGLLLCSGFRFFVIGARQIRLWTLRNW